MLKVLFPWKQNNTKKVLFAMEQVVNGAEPTTEELPPEDLPLLPCHVCNRTFLPNPLKKHIRVCEQTLRRKRKPFDSLKQRVEGTDMAPFYQKSYLKRSNPEISSLAQAGDVYGNNKVSKWREKHFELQKTIKNAKGTRSDMSTNPPTNTSTTPNRKVGHLAVSQSSSNERCPVCERSFGPKAFDRHVEFCKEQKNRVQVHKSPAVVQQAKERLDARINYRVPPLRQSKRALVRDKYCPTSQTNLLHRSNSIGPTKSTTSSSMSVTTMASNRRQPIINIEKNVERNNKKETASKTRIDRTIGDCGDSKESTKNENSSNRSFQTKRIIPAKKINKTEVNDCLQGITVSSLSVEKDKKLVTWKDTVKAQPKVAPSISLTTTSSNVKRKVVPNTNLSGELRTPIKVPSLSKVIRSRLLMEKLNMFVCKKDMEDVDRDHTDFAEDQEEESSVINDRVVEERSNVEDFSVLTHISEEGEIEDDLPKLAAKNFHKKRVSFAVDCPSQDIKRSDIREEDSMLKLNHQENSSDESNVSSSVYDAKSADNEDRRDDSDDETKTEDTSSLCLRLPLEGMESKVKLMNNDLDPERKLKKNIKSFYDIMKARGSKVATKREQLSLLESSKDIQLLVVSPKEEILSPTSSGNSFVEKYGVNNGCDAVLGVASEISKENHEIESNTTVENLEKDRAIFGLNRKKVTFKIASRQPRSWKRRKKFQKCRMCIRCFMRSVRSRRDVSWSNLGSSKKELDGFVTLGSSDNESVSGSPQILLEEPSEKIAKSSAEPEEAVSRKSQSANCLKTEQAERFTKKGCNRKKSSTGKTFHSLPNIHLDCYLKGAKPNSYKLSADNSFDNMVPRKRRKISASYLVSGDEEYEVLKQNISKIRKRKKEETPPLILDYQKIGLGSRKNSSADVLYINEVFASSVTPERSDLDSQDDGIQEYGDEELEGWEAVEEELLKELERNKPLMRCESPTKVSRTKINSFVDEESDIKVESHDMKLVESTKTLKNSSGCTIVNILCEETVPGRSRRLGASLGRPQDMSECPTELGKLEETATSPGKTYMIRNKSDSDKIPCRLPRIITQNKQTTPVRPLRASAQGDLKLPAIGKLILVRDAGVDVDMPSDKLVQVPSRGAKACFSFCQQTSQILVNNSSSFNREDLQEKQSPESQKNKSNRRLGTSSLSRHGGLEIKKALAEEKVDVSPKEETFKIDRTPTAEELYPDNPMMYEEFRKYEEMYRREKEERGISSRKQKKTADFGIHIEDISKSYGDSAYGSLNRKQQMEERDNSNQLKEFGADKISNAISPSEKLPKFCHECGNRYPVPSAKFCVECGVKRLVL